MLSSGDAAGGSDTSPRGDQPGFVQVLDAHTLAIPDRKGNQRADTFHNLLQDNRIALAALQPGRTRILHVHGTASITDDPALLETMALRGMPPQAALIVHVAGAEVVDSTAVTEANLWSQAAHVDPASVPDLMGLAAQHAAANSTGVTGVVMRLLKPLSRFLGPLATIGLRSAIRKEGYAAEPMPDSSGARQMRVAEIRRETADAVTVVLEDGEPVHFRPGQFFTLIVDIGARTVRRAYSASSVPGSARLELTVKRVEGGVFSTHANQVLRAGDQVAVRGPSGSLRAGEELVMVAAGSGVTPMMSIIRTELAGTAPARLALLYGNRDEQSTLFAGELARLERDHPDRLSVSHRLTRPSAAWTGERGRIDAGVVGAWLDKLEPTGAARYLLCGPEPVMSTVRDVLRQRGVAEDRIGQESYSSTVDVAVGGPQPMTVEQDGHKLAEVTVPPGETLLSAGLDAGVALPYSCTVGNCGECMVKLRGGEVVMSEPNCLTPELRAAGWVLTCAGRPQSAVTIDLAEE